MRLACAIPSRRVAAALLALACSAAIAQDARLQAIEAELEQLKKRVEVLEGRQAVPKAATAVEAPAPGADCANWERLEMSLTQPEVKAILGEPAKVDSTPLQIIWRYPCGRAYFDAESKRFLGYER